MILFRLWRIFQICQNTIVIFAALYKFKTQFAASLMANLRLLYYFLWRRASRDFIEGPIDFLSKWNWRSCNKKLMRGGCAKKAAKFLPLFLFAYFLAICAFLPPQAPKRALRILRQRLLALELQCTSSTTRRPQS